MVERKTSKKPSAKYDFFPRYGCLQFLIFTAFIYLLLAEKNVHKIIKIKDQN